MRREKVCESMNMEKPRNSYSDILQRLVRRYLFKLERQKEEGKDSVNVGADTIMAGATMSTEIAEFASGTDRERDSFHGPPGYRSAISRQQPSVHLDMDPSVPPATAPPVGALKRRLSLRSSGHPVRPNRTRPSPSISGSTTGCAAVQLLSIPQLDAIQRTLRILDVRLQHVQNNARDEERTRQDIDHVRRLMSENQNALSTVVTVLSSIQEEVRRLSITVHKHQTTTFHIQTPAQAGITSRSRTGMNNSKPEPTALAVIKASERNDRGSIPRDTRTNSLMNVLETSPL